MAELAFINETAQVLVVPLGMHPLQPIYKRALTKSGFNRNRKLQSATNALPKTTADDSELSRSSLDAEPLLIWKTKTL